MQAPTVHADGRDDAEMFERAPVALWLEDYSGLKTLFDAWRDAGVTDLRAFLLEDTARVTECSRHLKVLKVNRATLKLFEADNVEHLVANLHRVFRGDMFTTLIDELEQLWQGNTGLHQQYRQLRAVRARR